MGRGYDEGKKIGFRDGVMAGLRVVLQSDRPHLPAGRPYAARVNGSLSAHEPSRAMPHLTAHQPSSMWTICG